MSWTAQFTALDAAALALILAAATLAGLRIEARNVARKSTNVLMDDYRRQWFREFVTREPRIFDATILATLRQGTSFFASTCVIAIGGVVALIGNADRLTGLMAGLPLDSASPHVVQIKLLLPALFLVNGFLKLVWANRVFGYCAIVMAAVPNDAGAPLALPRAAQAAELNIRAAWNFNRGLRSMYFALAALAWLLGPWALMLATLAVLQVLLSREFASKSRGVIDPDRGASG